MKNDWTTYLTFFFIHKYFVNSIIKRLIPFLFEKTVGKFKMAVCTETAEIHNLFNT